MPVVKHLTKRQKKRKKSRDSASANDSKSDKNPKKCSGGKTLVARRNPTTNGILAKAHPGGAGEKSLARSQTPSSVDADLEEVEPNVWRVRMVIRYDFIQLGFVTLIRAIPLADHHGAALPLPPEMSAYSNQRNSCRNNRYTCISYCKNQIEEPAWDQYCGHQPSNRVLGHLITLENYRKIQGAYERSKLCKLKRLQAKKRKREKQAAMDEASKLSTPKSAGLDASPGSATAAPELCSPVEIVGPPEIGVPERRSSMELAGVAAPPDIAAVLAQAGLLMDLGPLSFQRYINGCRDWMFPFQSEALHKEATAQPDLASGPKLNPIGYEMLAKKQRLTQLAGGQQLEAEYAVLQLVMQMDAMALKAMTPDDLELAIVSSGLDVSELAYRPLDHSNWMCDAILNVVEETELLDSLWEARNILSQPQSPPDSYPQLSGSEIRAKMDCALAQVPESAARPMVQYPVQQPTYQNVQGIPAYQTVQVPPSYQTVQMSPAYEASQVPATFGTLQMPPTYDIDQMREHEQSSREAQVLGHPPSPSECSPTAGNRRVSNHIRGRSYYRGGKARAGQTQRQQSWQQSRQPENNSHGGRYSPYLQQPQFRQSYSSTMNPPNWVAAPVEQYYDMTPMGIPPDYNYGQYQSRPMGIPMGYVSYPGVPHGAPPLINHLNNSFATMPQPMNPSFPANVHNAQQMQSQQQKFKRPGSKFPTWEHAKSPGFVGLAEGAEPLHMTGDHYTPYATNWPDSAYAVPCAPDNANDFTLSDTNFPPLPVPLKTRQEKEKSSNNYV